MNIITIPKTFISGDLIVLPKKEYEALLGSFLKKREVNLTVSQKKKLSEVRKNISKGNFFNINELRTKLGIKN